MSKFKSKCYFEVGNNIDLTHKHPPLQLYEHYRHCYSDSLSPIVLMQYLDVPHWYQNIGLVSSDYMIHGCLRLCGHLHFWAPMFFRLSLILRSFLLFGLSPFFFEVFIIFGFISVFEVVFIFGIIFILTLSSKIMALYGNPS